MQEVLTSQFGQTKHSNEASLVRTSPSSTSDDCRPFVRYGQS